MSRHSHVRRMGFVLAAVAVVAVAAVTYGARPPERPEGRPGRPPEPEVEVVVLRFVHIPAESFVETLAQLGERNAEIRAGLEQLPIAVNEPANAVVVVAPVEAVGMLRETAEQLDQPNEFEMHAREREMQEHQRHLEMENRRRDLEREDIGFRMKMEEAKRRMSQPMPPMPPMPMPSGPGMMGSGKGRMRRGTCDPDCRCPNRGGPQCRGPGGMPACPCPMRGGKGMPCPMGPGGPGMRGPGKGMMGPGGPGMRGPGKGMVGPGGPGMRGPGKGTPCPMGEGKRPEGSPMGWWGREHPEGPRPLPWRKGPEREDRPPWARGEREHAEPARHPEEARDRVRERIEDIRRRIREEAEEGRRGRREGRYEEREEHRERAEREERRERGKRFEGRGPAMPDTPLGMFLTPRMREELRLSDEQVERIEDLTRNIRRHMEEVLREARERMERAGPEEREELGRRMREEAQEARERIMRRVHEALMDILGPEQREKAEQMLRRGREGPRDRPGPRGPMGAVPPAEGDRPHRPTVQEAPAAFRPIQDQGEGVRVWINGQPVEAYVQAEGPHQGRDHDHGDRGPDRQYGRGGSNWGQMSDEERQARIQQMRSRYLFQMLRDEDLRADAGITPVQERKIESLIKEYDEERKHIEDDIRRQFGDRRGDPGGDPQDAQRREYEMRREVAIATRDAQPLLDSIADQAVGLLSDEQKERLQAASQERNRLRMACGDLWLLTTRRAAKAIGLEPGQQQRIRIVLNEGLGRQTKRYEEMRDSYRDIIEEIRNMPPEQRQEAMRARWQEAMKFRDEGITDTRGRVFELLTRTQRDKAEQFLEEARKEQSGGMMGGFMQRARGWMQQGGQGGPGGRGAQGGNRGPGGPGAAGVPVGPGPQGAAPAPDAVRQAEGLLV